MATLILDTISNGVPHMNYKVNCTPSRSGKNVTYKLDITGKFVNPSGSNTTGSYLGTGSGCYLKFEATFNGVTKTVYFKNENESLSLNNGKTKTVSLTISLSNSSGAAVKGTVTVTSGYFTASVFGSKSVTLPKVTPYYTNPTVPTNVKVQGVASYNNLYGSPITITWTASKGGENNPVGKYELQIRHKHPGESNWSGWSKWGDIGTSTSKTWTPLNGIVSGTINQYCVVAHGKNSGKSAQSSPVTVTFLFKPEITSLTAVPSINTSVDQTVTQQVILNWVAKEYTLNPIKWFEVWFNTRNSDGSWNRGKMIGLSATARTYTITRSNITPGTRYRFEVVACGDYSISESNYQSQNYTGTYHWALAPSTPGKPSLSATKIKPKQSVTISVGAVNPNEGTIKQYHYYAEYLQNETWTEAAKVNVGSTSLTTYPRQFSAWFPNENIPVGAKLRFKVRAENSTGMWSNASPVSDVLEIISEADIYYCNNGKWTPYEVYYPVNGEWKKCEVYFPVNGIWKKSEVN